MKKTFILILTVFVAANMFATVSDSAKYYNKKAFSIRWIDNEKMLAYADSALAYATDNNDIARAYNNKAYALYMLSRYNDLNKCIEEYEKWNPEYYKNKELEDAILKIIKTKRDFRLCEHKNYYKWKNDENFYFDKKYKRYLKRSDTLYQWAWSEYFLNDIILDYYYISIIDNFTFGKNKKLLRIPQYDTIQKANVYYSLACCYKNHAGTIASSKYKNNVRAVYLDSVFHYIEKSVYLFFDTTGNSTGYKSNYQLANLYQMFGEVLSDDTAVVSLLNSESVKIVDKEKSDSVSCRKYFGKEIEKIATLMGYDTKYEDTALWFLLKSDTLFLSTGDDYQTFSSHVVVSDHFREKDLMKESLEYLNKANCVKDTLKNQGMTPYVWLERLYKRLLLDMLNDSLNEIANEHVLTHDSLYKIADSLVHAHEKNTENVKINIENILEDKNRIEHKQNNTLWIGGYIIIVLLVALLIVYITLKKKKQEEDDRKERELEEEKKKIEEYKGLSECIRIYEVYKKDPKLVEMLAKEMIKSIFKGVNINDFMFAYCYYDHDRNKNELQGKAYEESKINPYKVNLDDKNRPGVRAFYDGEFYDGNYKPGDNEDEVTQTENGPTKTLFFLSLVGEDNKSKNKKSKGIISIQSKKENAFTDSQKEMFRLLRNYIVTSLTTGIDMLKSFDETITEFSTTDYQNIDRHCMQGLFNQVYRLLFGKDADEDSEDLFSLSILLKEKITDEDKEKLKNDFKLSEELKSKAHQQEEVLREYNYERFNRDGKYESGYTTTAIHLDDLQRPATLCFRDNIYVDIDDWQNNEYYEKYCRENGIKPIYIIENGEKKRVASNDGLNTSSLLYYPIKSENNIYGVLSFQHEKKSYFDKQHVLILKLLAAVIGVTIQSKLKNDEKRIKVLESMGSMVRHNINTPTSSLQIELQTTKDYLKGCAIDNTIKDKVLSQYDRMFSATEDIERWTALIGRTKRDDILREIEWLDLFGIIEIQRERIFNKVKPDGIYDKQREKKFKIWQRLGFETQLLIDGVEQSDKNIKIYSVKALCSQIFYNLLLNTYEHAFNDVDDGFNPLIKITVFVDNKKDTITIQYFNNGKKFDMRDTNWVFGYRNTTKTTEIQGGGVGLYGVQFFVTNLLNGKIEAKNSASGQGVEFIITLPNINETPIK